MVKQEAESSIDLDKLFEIAMKGDWDKVVQAYTYSSGEIIENHKASGGSAKQDTALHVAVAVANDETEHVSEIIKGIPDSNLLEILRMKNCMGCTPLHLAAANGNLDICHSIASKDKSLIAETNNEGFSDLDFISDHGSFRL